MSLESFFTSPFVKRVSPELARERECVSDSLCVRVRVRVCVRLTRQVRYNSSWISRSKLAAVGSHQRCRDAVVVLTNACFSTCSVGCGSEVASGDDIKEFA
jgi:hypothetical protein